LHGLQIRRAADELTRKSPRPLEQHRQDFSAALRIESLTMPLDQFLQPREPLDLVRFGDLISAIGRGVPGRGEYLNENAAA